jgi:hypothetical protein
VCSPGPRPWPLGGVCVCVCVCVFSLSLSLSVRESVWFSEGLVFRAGGARAVGCGD